VWAGRDVTLICPSKFTSTWFKGMPSDKGLMKNVTSNIMEIKKIGTMFTGNLYCFGIDFKYKKNNMVLSRFMSKVEIRVYGKFKK